MDLMAHSRAFAMADANFMPTPPTPTHSKAQPSYGYHNTFRTSSLPILAKPPSYDHATSPKTMAWHHSKRLAEAAQSASHKLPPPYSCSVEACALLSMRQESTSVFEAAYSDRWLNVYAELRGTTLYLHRPKSTLLTRNLPPAPGRLIKAFTLQHAEVGVAADFKDSIPAPKSALARLAPASARRKLLKSDPHLFEPVREHALRLRLETDQFLLCAQSEEDMLSWAEKLCAAIDISPPLEDRSEPRYRSLPRRNRRQRMLDGARLADQMQQLSTLEVGRRIIAAQEDMFRQLYAHVSADAVLDVCEPPADNHVDREDWLDVQHARLAGSTRPPQDSQRPLTAGVSHASKSPPLTRQTCSQALRYRRRCAPVLLACSPRVSDVVFSNGCRMRINTRDRQLDPYTSHAPRYDSHGFRATRRSKGVGNGASRPPSQPSMSAQPARPLAIRTTSNVSASSSSSYDLVEIRSHEVDVVDETRSLGPSPTAPACAKLDVKNQLLTLAKRNGSESDDLPSADHVRVVTLDVGVVG